MVLIAALAFVSAMSAPAFAADASSNWYEASGPVPSAVMQAGAIDHPGDVDWYYFYNDVPAGVTAGALKIGINRAVGSGDNSTLNLYRWDGGKLVSVGARDTTSGSPFSAALAAGLYYVRISGYNSSLSAGSYDFTVAGDYVKVVPAPQLSKLSPTSGKRGTTVTITGTGFGAARGTSSVSFGAAKCTAYISWSATQITCRVPATAKYGKVKITVTTPAGQSAALTFSVKR